MAIRAKGRRRITVDGREYLWWVAVDEDGWCALRLTVVSRDRGTIVRCELQSAAPEPGYVVRRLFVKSGERLRRAAAQTEAAVSRMGDAITPLDVAALIRLSTGASVDGRPPGRRTPDATKPSLVRPVPANRGRR